jgi:lipopolysaccharide export system protein LptA
MGDAVIRRSSLAAIAVLALIAAADTVPVKITGDNFVVDDASHKATFTGNVVVTKTDLKLWAPKVVIDYGAGDTSNIKSFVASGGVRIKTKDQDATGDKAIYDPSSKLLHLTGHVMVVSAAGTVGSSDLVVNLETNTSVFTGKSGTRVTGVFTPK